MAEPIVFEFRYETRAPIARAFRALSDTDAFNRAASANMTFTTEVGPDGTPRAMGSVSKLGMTVRWQERPFSFRAPHWFTTRRDFENGPRVADDRARAAAAVTGRRHPHPLPARGPRSRRDLPPRREFRFEAYARAEAARRARGGRGPARLRRRRRPRAQRRRAAPPALKADEARRLQELADLLEPTHIRGRLLSFIRAAPEREQSGMSPITLAEAWMATLEDVTLLLIACAKIGMLGVRIDLLCPSCLVPKAFVDEHGNLPETHCDTCGVPLDATYPDSLAVHFFTSPKIRALRVKTECLGSPHRTPHVAAQDAVPPGGEANLATPLEPGTYQLRTLPAVGPPALLDVRDVEQRTEAIFTVLGSIQPQLAHVRSEPRSIRVLNGTSREIVAVLERLEPPRKVVSLGRLLVEYPVLRELVPATGFISAMTTYEGAAVAVRSATPKDAEQLGAGLARAKLVHASGCVTLALYPDAASAHDDLVALDLGRLLVGVSEGVVCESTMAGRRVPVGPAVDEAFAAMCAAGFGNIGRGPLAPTT
jgi:hypothetical protein